MTMHNCTLLFKMDSRGNSLYDVNWFNKYLCVPGVPKKVLCLINNRTKAFYLISEMFFSLDEGDPNLNFDILFFSFR